MLSIGIVLKKDQERSVERLSTARSKSKKLEVPQSPRKGKLSNKITKKESLNSSSGIRNSKNTTSSKKLKMVKRITDPNKSTKLDQFAVKKSQSSHRDHSKVI
jgi:hypothetical protein